MRSPDTGGGQTFELVSRRSGESEAPCRAKAQSPHGSRAARLESRALPKPVHETSFSYLGEAVSRRGSCGLEFGKKCSRRIDLQKLDGGGDVSHNGRKCDRLGLGPACSDYGAAAIVIAAARAADGERLRLGCCHCRPMTGVNLRGLANTACMRRRSSAQRQRHWDKVAHEREEQQQSGCQAMHDSRIPSIEQNPEWAQAKAGEAPAPHFSRALSH